MDLQLDGKAFIVTGGTDGLGLAAAKQLLAEGASVLVTGRSPGKFARAQGILAAGEERVAFLAADNADPEAPAKSREAVFARWGRLDGLLVSVGGPTAGRALDTSDATWREAFERIFLGSIRLVRDLSPFIADGGAIVLVLAVSAKEAADEIPISNGLRPGLAMLTKSFAAELGPRGIRVNALLPNLFSTGRVRELLGDHAPLLDRIPLGRIGDPDEFGRIAAVLLSPVASYVTGTAIPVDGGQLRCL